MEIQETPNSYKLETLKVDMRYDKFVHVHVVPYHQDAMEDRLMDRDRKHERDELAIKSYDLHR